MFPWPPTDPKCDCGTVRSYVFPIDSSETHSHSTTVITTALITEYNCDYCLLQILPATSWLSGQLCFELKLGNILPLHFLHVCQPICACRSPFVKPNAGLQLFDHSQNWSSVTLWMEQSVCRWMIVLGSITYANVRKSLCMLVMYDKKSEKNRHRVCSGG